PSVPLGLDPRGLVRTYLSPLGLRLAPSRSYPRWRLGLPPGAPTERFAARGADGAMSRDREHRDRSVSPAERCRGLALPGRTAAEARRSRQTELDGERSTFRGQSRPHTAPADGA